MSTQQDIMLAGFWRRTAAHIMDSLMQMFVLISLFFLLDYVIAYKLLVIVLIVMIGVIGIPIYKCMFESSQWQATPGKRWLGLQVTNLKGERISFRRSFYRAVLWYATGMITYSLTYVVAAFTPKKQCVHDIIAETLVVRHA